MITCRHFYLKSHAVTHPNINMNDLPGSAGRIDIVARCINSAFWLSYGIRKDVVFHTILHGEPSPPVYIRIEGDKLRKVSPDERNIAIFIKKAIERMKENMEVESTPGIFVSKKSFNELLEENKDKDFYLLDEKGEEIDNVKIGRKPFFLIGDNMDFEEEEKEIIYKYGAKSVSLGKKSYLSSHCITILNWLMDKI
ncbi:MAG TPA: tRNA (pseudouridine(54)-N(1))-methyltransferase TrmY [Thermoplasmatales archaeon]|nr:tRNA (pseudouridine(54)-N(1))-methyltransferase TrmY [Thermoplasmatales archaeon]